MHERPDAARMRPFDLATRAVTGRHVRYRRRPYTALPGRDRRQGPGDLSVLCLAEAPDPPAWPRRSPSSLTATDQGDQSVMQPPETIETETKLTRVGDGPILTPREGIGLARADVSSLLSGA